MRCGTCGTENEPGRKFCGECGASLAAACPVCGTPNPPTVKFCGECGSRLEGSGPAPTAAPREARTEPVAERRLVSVLFADLVGFTPLSEERDAEEVRDLLGRYFDTCRRTIGRYGGTVEKFIGDAVMAVWGTPTAKEDDAERAVRAALDLVGAVETLGQEVGVPALRARAAVATGEAAVSLSAEAAGQGMVAGDLVNTASRIQGAAPPGGVLVDEATRRATEAAVVHEDAGAHELKGKAEPVPLWRAVRVIGGVGGALRSTGLEAPFVGRDGELRLLKELFHASAEDGKAHLLSVVGIAGIGKSRLSWELFKYIDGLVQGVWWHRGRCLAYGEGVTYWALAEMIRMRARIAEGEDADSAQSKLRAALAEHVPDPEERRWAEPRLAHLLGLEAREAPNREDLFAASRLFFERLAGTAPTILVFEDMQWADPALLEFVEYLLDWSRSHPLFVLTLARPELFERHPGWGGGKRNATTLHLEPLLAEAMAELLSGLAPGLPDEVREQILERAEGVPLYAVETVRMLMDRGLLVREGNELRLTGPVESLAVPETLHALIAARLDGLSSEERSLLQDASVAGKTFSVQTLAVTTGRGQAELPDLLSALIRKEVLSVQADPRSPEHGQYGFLQDLVRRVAYETLSRRDRKVRHLAVADHLASGAEFEPDEVVELVAAHFLDAYHAAPDDEDALEIRGRAREALAAAGRRAASLAARETASRYFVRAADLAEDPVAQAELLEQAGVQARLADRLDEATDLLEKARSVFEEAGRPHPAARVSARLGEISWWQQRNISEAIERMEAAFAVLSAEEPDADLAELAAELARLHYFQGSLQLAAERVETALQVAEALWLPGVLSQALNTKGLVMGSRGRIEESLALLKHALEVAEDNDQPVAALRALGNLSYTTATLGRFDDALAYEEAGIAQARRVGIRNFEWFLTSHLATNRFLRGRWDEALTVAAEIPDPADIPAAQAAWAIGTCQVIRVLLERGEVQAGRELFDRVRDTSGHEIDAQTRAFLATYASLVLLAEGRFAEAIDTAAISIQERATMGLHHYEVSQPLVTAVEASLALGDLDRAGELLGIVDASPPGHVSPFLRAHVHRLHARLLAARGEHDPVESGFKASAGLFRELGLPFFLAVTLAEHDGWLGARGQEEAGRPLRDEAREIFERLGARPRLERLAAGVEAAATSA